MISNQLPYKTQTDLSILEGKYGIKILCCPNLGGMYVPILKGNVRLTDKAFYTKEDAIRGAFQVLAEQAQTQEDEVPLPKRKVFDDVWKRKYIDLLCSGLDDAFDDGSSVIEHVLTANPDMKTRLLKLLFEKEATDDSERDH